MNQGVGTPRRLRIEHRPRNRQEAERKKREGLQGAPELIDTLVKVPMLISAGLRALEQATTRPSENPFAGMRGTMYAGFCLVAGAILAAFGAPAYLWGPLFGLSAILAIRRGR